MNRHVPGLNGAAGFFATQRALHHTPTTPRSSAQLSTAQHSSAHHTTPHHEGGGEARESVRDLGGEFGRFDYVKEAHELLFGGFQRHRLHVTEVLEREVFAVI